MDAQVFRKFSVAYLGGGILVLVSMFLSDIDRFTLMVIGMVFLIHSTHIERREGKAAPAKASGWMLVLALIALVAALITLQAYGVIPHGIVRSLVVLAWVIYIINGWLGARRRWNEP